MKLEDAQKLAKVLAQVQQEHGPRKAAQLIEQVDKHRAMLEGKPGGEAKLPTFVQQVINQVRLKLPSMEAAKPLPQSLPSLPPQLEKPQRSSTIDAVKSVAPAPTPIRKEELPPVQQPQAKLPAPPLSATSIHSAPIPFVPPQRSSQMPTGLERVIRQPNAYHNAQRLRNIGLAIKPTKVMKHQRPDTLLGLPSPQAPQSVPSSKPTELLPTPPAMRQLPGPIPNAPKASPSQGLASSGMSEVVGVLSNILAALKQKEPSKSPAPGARAAGPARIAKVGEK
jgi:hypothetical protein